MKRVKSAVREINSTLNYFAAIEILLNTSVVFLGLYFILSLFNLYPVVATIPAGYYLYKNVRQARGVNKALEVEKQYGPLREKLRTAIDNSATDNEVTEELEKEVLFDLKHVSISSFVNSKSIATKVILTMVLAFAIVFTTATNLAILNVPQFVTEIPDYVQNIDIGGDTRTGTLSLLDAQINESDEIYGDEDLAVLGSSAVDIKIKPLNFEVNVKEGGDGKKKSFDSLFPDEVYVEQSSSFDERIPEDQQDLVKDYFDSLTT